MASQWGRKETVVWPPQVPADGKPGEFFTETPQKIFAHLMKYRPSTQDLVAWMSNPDEIDRRVAGTELESIISEDAPDQRNGVLGSLGLIADSLRLLPTKEQANGKEWSATGWADKREGWIFLTGTEAEQEALRPLHSLWIDLLILRLLTLPKPGQKRAWFVLDELATLQRLPQFHSALTKGRKSDNPIIFGYQGKAQLEVIYGHLAEVMLSQPATKLILKTAEPKAAKWASELIGEIEIERVRETIADGKRAGKSFTMDRQIEPLVMSSEIQGLEDLHSFMKLGNNVTRFSFPHMDRPLIAPPFIPRDIPEGDMWLNPLAPSEPAPKPPVPAGAAIQVPAAETPSVKKKVPVVVTPSRASTPSEATVIPPTPPANVTIRGSFMRFLSPARVLVTASLVCALAPAPAFGAPNNRAIRDQLVALYPLTRVGMNGLAGFDYTRVTEPGPIYAVRLPGIYADVANTRNAIIETNYTNGQITQATGFAAAFGGNTSHSRTLAPEEKVYVTQITVKRDAAMFELLTVDVATLGDGRGTRYRAELNVKLPGLENMTPEDMKKTIDTVLADPATASAVQSKTIKLGMSPDEVKQSLGNPEKIVDLGSKQMYVYKDMKVVFVNNQVSDVQ